MVAVENVSLDARAKFSLISIRHVPCVCLFERAGIIGVSREGHINKSVKVRPRLKDSRPRSLGGTMARKQDGGALRQHLRKEDGQSSRL